MAAHLGESIQASARDFDFWMGDWKVRNRRLKARLAGSDEWEEFEATSVARPILGALGNEDVFLTDHDGGFVGMSFRFFDPVKRRWSIYWADSRRSGELDPPVFGTFSDEIGVFHGRDTFEGRPILVRFIWSGITTRTPRWEQAFSADDGATWETNWIMDFSPAEVSESAAGAVASGCASFLPGRRASSASVCSRSSSAPATSSPE